MASFDPLTAALDVGGKIIDRLWPDPTQRDQARLALMEMAQKGELAESGTVEEVFTNPHTDAAKRLVFQTAQGTLQMKGKRCIRIVFNEISSFEPDAVCANNSSDLIARSASSATVSFERMASFITSIIFVCRLIFLDFKY